jgi:hypothetical protein
VRRRSGEIGEEGRGLTCGADVRERGLTVGRGLTMRVSSKRVMGWVNGPGPVRRK